MLQLYLAAKKNHTFKRCRQHWLQWWQEELSAANRFSHCSLKRTACHRQDGSKPDWNTSRSIYYIAGTSRRRDPKSSQGNWHSQKKLGNSRRNGQSAWLNNLVFWLSYRHHLIVYMNCMFFAVNKFVCLSKRCLRQLYLINTATQRHSDTDRFQIILLLILLWL